MKNKLYESYYYREIRNGRKPLPEEIYMKERAAGPRRKDGKYKAPTYEERMGLARKTGEFIRNGKLDVSAVSACILEMAEKVDNNKTSKGSRTHYENRIIRLQTVLEAYKAGRSYQDLVSEYAGQEL